MTLVVEKRLVNPMGGLKEKRKRKEYKDLKNTVYLFDFVLIVY